MNTQKATAELAKTVGGTVKTAKVKVVGSIPLSSETIMKAKKATMRSRTFSPICNNIPQTYQRTGKNFDELNDCLTFLRDNCGNNVAIDIKKRAVARLAGAPFSIRANAALDALKNHHSWKVVQVKTLEA